MRNQFILALTTMILSYTQEYNTENRIMKKSIFLLVLVLFNSLFVLGQTKYKMVIETNNGAKYNYNTNEIKIITFEIDEGGDENPDNDNGTRAYFAYQNPVHTLVLGNDIYDNSLDNAHKCRIWSTMGGAYSGCDAVVSVIIDESLCNNLYFLDDRGYERAKVLPMPQDYYNYDEVKNATINYNGDSRGYLEIQFKDAYFNDPQSIYTTYVIPVRMTGVTGLGGIFTGTPNVEDPVRTNPQDWSVQPKDYILYCVKYMNPWQGKYIRRGVDLVTENGVTTNIVRKDFSLINYNPGYYEGNPVNANDEVCAITTKNMKQAIFPVSFKTSNAYIACNLILTFEGNTCTISTDDENVTATGSGEFIIKGTERSEYKDYQWGSNNGEPVQRDILRLAYNVNFTDKNIQIATADTMVVQTRDSNQRQFFQYKYIK